jgi:hypothetical protein
MLVEKGFGENPVSIATRQHGRDAEAGKLLGDRVHEPAADAWICGANPLAASMNNDEAALRIERARAPIKVLTEIEIIIEGARRKWPGRES